MPATFLNTKCCANVAVNVAGKPPAQRAKNAVRNIATLFIAKIIFRALVSVRRVCEPFSAGTTKKTVYGQNKCCDVAVTLKTSIRAKTTATFCATFLRAKCCTPHTLAFVRKDKCCTPYTLGFYLLEV